jgi:hypothetical protein
MTVYRIQIRGSGYLMAVEGGPPVSHGFYVVHWVTAAFPAEARERAIELVRDSPKVVGQTGLRLEVDEMEEVGPEEHARTASGFVFFADEAPPN